MKNTILLLLALGLCIFTLSYQKVDNPKVLIWSDMEGYYIYQPAMFIYGGFKKEAVVDTGYLRPWPGTNKIFSKYTCGVALLEWPFFLSAHALSKPLGYPSDGRSTIYGYGLMAAGAVYFVLGMLLLYRFLTRYFKTFTVKFTLAALFLGTNLMYYTIIQPAMSHIYSFFLFSVLLYLTDNTFKNSNPGGRRFFLQYALLGLISGWIVLIRPTNILILLYPLYRWMQATPDKINFVKRFYSGSRFKIN